MTVTIFRPGQRLVIPSPSVQVWTPGVSAGAGGDWWDVAGATCVAAYAAKGAADLAASYINLANPGTYNAAPGVAPTWDATNGWTFNGSTQYLTAGVVPVTDQTWSALVRFSDRSNNNSTPFYVSSGSGKNFYVGYFSGYYVGNGGEKSLGSPPNDGVFGFAGATAYVNGIASIGAIPASSGVTTYPLYIGAGNNNGSLLFAFAGKIQALAIYSTTLSAGDVASLTTAMNDL